MTTHRTVLPALAASLALLAAPAAADAKRVQKAECKSENTLQADITAKGVSCSRARELVDVLNLSMATEPGTTVEVNDPETGKTSVSFRAGAWTCIKVVKRTPSEEKDTAPEESGRAVCTAKNNRRVEWRIVSTQEILDADANQGA